MIVANAQLDKQRWDRRVLAEQPEGFFFLLSWYLDSVAPGWEGYVLGDYEGIYPIVPQQKFGCLIRTCRFLHGALFRSVLMIHNPWLFNITFRSVFPICSWRG